MTKGWKSESARHALARKGIKTGRKKKTYYYANEKTKKGKYIVFKTSEEDKARTIAKKKGFHLAGGLFTANAKPYDFKRNYKVINVPESTKETIDPNAQFIDNLIAYESGELTPTNETKFLKQIKKKGLAGKLQGHYGREIARRGL